MIIARTATSITFLGTSTATPDVGSDTASFLINHSILVDTGWNVVSNLRNLGVQPSDLKYVLFTHFHHDHYLSLPSLLYFLLSRKKLGEVTFIGPQAELEFVIKQALSFLQVERFWPGVELPKLIPLTPGQSYEAEEFKFTTCPTLHPVEGVCYRFWDKVTGKEFSFAGDSAYYEPIIEHVRGTSLLIHEASLGPVEADPEKNAFLHSGAIDAGKVASQAEVGQLMLVHGPLAKAEESVRAAQEVFTGHVLWPIEGKTYEV
ncbi:MBL fold metallo-hydrolase [Paenibacillus koleovorans]|uniref:MBL fold metallo-hydrolase n=1 Tax=Paenibacillus koleovorans TaxID=121608 RepID=UPI000FD856D8|nr:MBL fold metallo-hydrolase [Paenibacillus koleovorans]